MRNYIICYDISDPKRLQRVHRYVSNEADFLQRSVYRLTADQESLKCFFLTLGSMICEKSDDVRLYPVSPKTQIQTWGKQESIEGIYLLDETG